jgi:hypothetical protein
MGGGAGGFQLPASMFVFRGGAVVQLRIEDDYIQGRGRPRYTTAMG